ncbi:MAG: matrixin family metalloprotease [Candidatus Thorarchaeota archaeon]
MKRSVIALLVAVLLISSSAVTVIAKTDSPSVLQDRGIEKTVLIHYEAPGKPPGTPGNGPGGGDKEPKEEQGYKLFRGGIKWADGDTPVSYLINTSTIPALINPDGINPVDEIIAAFEAWDAATSKELFDDTPGTTAASGANFGDGNVISWTNLGNTGIIAVTTFWWWTGTKELAAFDMEFNTQFNWGIDPDGEGIGYVLSGAMDIRNIATHEAGHTMVLEDLYQSQFTEMTMYGYSTEGEVKAISLEPGDIAGVQALYGS